MEEELTSFLEFKINDVGGESRTFLTWLCQKFSTDSQTITNNNKKYLYSLCYVNIICHPKFSSQNSQRCFILSRNNNKSRSYTRSDEDFTKKRSSCRREMYATTYISKILSCLSRILFVLLGKLSSFITFGTKPSPCNLRTAHFYSFEFCEFRQGLKFFKIPLKYQVIRKMFLTRELLLTCETCLLINKSNGRHKSRANLSNHRDKTYKKQWNHIKTVACGLINQFNFSKPETHEWNCSYVKRTKQREQKRSVIKLG